MYDKDFNSTVLFPLNNSSCISLIFWKPFALCVFILYRAVFKGCTPIVFSNCHWDCLIKISVLTSAVPLFLFLLCLVFSIRNVTESQHWCISSYDSIVSWNITSFLFLHVAFFNLTSQSHYFFSEKHNAFKIWLLLFYQSLCFNFKQIQPL